MDRDFTDKKIMEYNKKIFGFSLAKTRNSEEAEELASRIVLEVYASLLTCREVINGNAYIYSIAHNVYVRYVNECVKHRHVGLDGVVSVSEQDFTKEIERTEMMQILRREIAYLGKTHRQIVVKHYYERKTVREIAAELHLSEGTVKWYLHDARALMKKGMSKMRTTGNLGLNPICLTDFGYDGTAGTNGATEYYLATAIRQNIVYATYHQERTINELAEELGISPVFLQDEVELLKENGFLTEKAGGKYCSNVVIHDTDADTSRKVFECRRRLARIICEEYLTGLKENVKHYDTKRIYVPEEDSNFLLWGLFTYVKQKLCQFLLEGDVEYRYRIRTTDGGLYVPTATVKGAVTEVARPFSPEHYHVSYMTMDLLEEKTYPCFGMQMSTDFDTRGKWGRENRQSDYIDFCRFLKGNLPKEEALAERYQRLYDRGFLWNADGKDEANMILLNTEGLSCDDSSIQDCMDTMLKGILPEISEELRKKIRETAEETFELQKPYYPERFHEYGKQGCAYLAVDLVELIDSALEMEILKPLSERQKKGVLSIVAVEHCLK